MGSDSRESEQTQDFKNKMKVSNPLNDIAANLGVTPKVLTQLATGDDQEFRELVRGIFSILPEDEVAMVATDSTINGDFLDYLSRLFEDNQRILITIMYNPSSNPETKKWILEKLPEGAIVSIAKDAKAPSSLLSEISAFYRGSPEILAFLLANPSTPEDLKEAIIAESSAEIAPQDLEQITVDSFDEEIPAARGNYEGGDVDAKIALCVDKLYEINANIVTEFIKKARSEIVKRLQLIAKANRIVLKTIMNHPSLTIEELERIDLDMFASLLRKLPEDVDDQTVLKLLQQAKKK